MTANDLYTRLVQLSLTRVEWSAFTSDDARAAIQGYEGVIAGRVEGKPVTLEGAFEVVYGTPLHEKQKRRRA